MNIDKTKFLDILRTLREHINLITHDVDRIIDSVENSEEEESLKKYNIAQLKNSMEKVIADFFRTDEVSDDENETHAERPKHYDGLEDFAKKPKHYDGLEDFAKKHLVNDVTSYSETFEEKECSLAWWSTLQGLSFHNNRWFSIPGGYATVSTFDYATNPPIPAYQVHVWKSEKPTTL